MKGKHDNLVVFMVGMSFGFLCASPSGSPASWLMYFVLGVCMILIMLDVV